MVRPILESAILIALVAWGIYGIVTVTAFPSPSSGEGLVGDILRRVSYSFNINQTIGPNWTALFITIFQARPTYNASQGWPQSQTYAVPGHHATSWGPFLPSDPSSTVSSFERRFAVFTISLRLSGASVWGLFGGPGSNGTFPTTYESPPFTYSSPLPTQFGSASGLEIVEADGPGNYTLYVNSSNNSTVKVIMGYSSLTFVPSRPFFYFGVGSLIIGGGYLSAKVFSFWKKPRDKNLKNETIRRIPLGVPTD